jgi:hypothetical protein
VYAPEGAYDAEGMYVGVEYDAAAGESDDADIPNGAYAEGAAEVSAPVADAARLAAVLNKAFLAALAFPSSRSLLLYRIHTMAITSNTPKTTANTMPAIFPASSHGLGVVVASMKERLSLRVLRYLLALKCSVTKRR